MNDLKLSLRMLARSPFLVLAAVVSLALGMGANAATFSLLYQVLLRPLPVDEPERLVNFAAPGPNAGMQSCSTAGECDVIFSYPMLRDLERDPQEAFTGIAAHRSFGANLSFRGQTLDGDGMLVSGGYFTVLGLRPALGRLLGPEDDRTFGGHFMVVLSHEYWRTRFGESERILGETLTVNGQPMTIVGVAPPGFSGTVLGERPQVFVPLAMHGLMIPQWGERLFENRRAYWLYLFGRLRPGVTIEQARSAINVPYRALINEVEAPLQEGMSDATLARFKAKEIELSDGRRGQSNLHAQGRAPVLLLFGVTAVVLLIACANVANLLLSRTARRATEIAVRLSVGASRFRLVRQLLVESCLLAVLAGLAGLAVSRWTLALIGSLLPPEAIPTLRFELHTPVVLFTLGVALGTGILFGLFPALHSTRPDLVAMLKAEAGQPAGARAASRFRSSLATAQIALAMTLLIAAGLFARSLANIGRVDVGFQIENRIQFSLSPELNNYTPEETLSLFGRLEDELSAIPGVTGVSASLVPLVAGSNWGSNVSVEGFEAGPDTDTNSRFNEIGADYFRTLGIAVLRGREFTRADAAGAPKVAIVNEAFAKKFGIASDPIGRRMRTGRGEELDTEIVGLVPNTKYSEVKQEPPPLYFTPYRQDERLGFLTFYVSSALPPEELLAAVRSAVARLDPNLPVKNLKTLREQVRENVFVDRMISTLSAAFAALATALAAVGLYGVLAYHVVQRTREIGLRMALGADGGRVRRMVLGQVGRMTLVGAAIGIPAALGLGRVARSLLFEVEGHDPVVFITSVALVVLIALTAGFIPALNASRIDPMRALRYE